MALKVLTIFFENFIIINDLYDSNFKNKSEDNIEKMEMAKSQLISLIEKDKEENSKYYSRMQLIAISLNVRSVLNFKNKFNNFDNNKKDLRLVL